MVDYLIPKSLFFNKKYHMWYPTDNSNNDSFYPLIVSKTFSKDYKLYLQYKGIESPSNNMKEAFKNANIDLPKEIDLL